MKISLNKTKSVADRTTNERNRSVNFKKYNESYKIGLLKRIIH